MKRMLLTIVFVFFLVLFFNIELKANAAYSTSGSVSTQSTLTVVVLPAIEQVTLSDQSWQTPTQLNRNINIGVRANFNNWFLDYQIVQNTGRINPANCDRFGTIGNRNLNNSFQEIGLNCSQDISSGDSTDYPVIDVIYQVKPSL